ncbi:stage 0 sporulation protein [Patescibacteria group bacterium]|nr:stage 0 sporulation protein [Patescibacteria group bacterium]MBU1663189.1 stage 0 sporulation protein [Patescibacteria group bacterium]MBU1934309.1 stage 0 sporulation protein [Patescibacteria group bacterium]MBU2007886.1 stage 0 sporulation protein [Patescibacteria group bacterium]MBU2233769.1 stage 0 sporulation protein [Patescibacteria group bacterium]
MKLVQVQFSSWDKRYNFDAAEIDVKVGDQVIVKTELGVEFGKVVGCQDLSDTKNKIKAENGVEDGCSADLQQTEVKKILRKATAVDLKKLPDEKQKKKDFTYCKKIIEKYQLPMKLVDVHYSFDDVRVTFPFIADSRIDFRELVKDLTKHFGRSIRLQQIGIRDEARFCGDFGHCGRSLCCTRFLGSLNSITSEMAELQQCVHRGSERISGVCGRLMCCLSYEEEGYKKLAEHLPLIDSQVKIEGRKGRVVARHILKQTVKVLLDESNGEAGGVVEVEAGKVQFLKIKI